MEQKSQEMDKTQGTGTKTRVPHLDKLLKLDACFRNPNPAKCTLEAIQDVFRDDPAFDNKPIIKQTLHNYLNFLRGDLGAQFKGKEINVERTSKKKDDGKKHKHKIYTFRYAKWNGKSYYQYEDVNAPIPKLQALIGKNSKDSGVALMKALDIEEQENMATPLHIWLRLFLNQMITEQSTALNVVSFYENIDLDDLNIHKFERLLKAILDKQPLKLHYLAKTGKPINALVLPYRLKNYNQRWYLIGKCYNPTPNEKHPDEFYEGYSPYALDGIVDQLDTDGKTILVPAIQDWDYEYIEPDNEDIDDFFDDMVGVTASKAGPEDVYLRFTPERYVYVESKPIVGSQKKPISEGHEYYREGWVTIKLRAHINKELEQQVLSFGSDCEVVAPESFREQVRAKIAAMVALYGEKS